MTQRSPVSDNTKRPASAPPDKGQSPTTPADEPLDLIAAQPQWSRKEKSARMVQLCVEDLAEELNVSAQNVKVKSVLAVNWRNANLGIKQRGRDKIPGIVPGFRVLLTYQGREYDYHTGFGEVALCPVGRAEDPMPPESL